MEHYRGLLSKYNVDKGIIVKGVKGLSNPTKVPEPIDKGILRSKHKVFVYKDGTVRFDITNAPLTHFKVSETRISIQKLKELGYDRDSRGKDLVSPDQIVELKVQDIMYRIAARNTSFAPRSMLMKCS
jgi:DNA polymerase II large subunit